MPESEWPQFTEDKQKHKVDVTETRKEAKPPKKTRNKPRFQANTVTKDEEENPIFSHLLETCSTFSKISRTLTYVNRFIKNARTAN